MANLDTVEYLVKAMIKAGVSREQIILVSRDCAWLFGVSSKAEAEKVTEEYLDKYEKEQPIDKNN